MAVIWLLHSPSWVPSWEPGNKNYGRMEKGLTEKTGKQLDYWINVVKESKIEKHSDIINFLKVEHGLSYGFANFVALKANKSDAGSFEESDLLINQYKGKEHFKPVYDKLIAHIQTFGNDITIAPKKTYFSLIRKKQFAILNPATKTRFEIGVNLKGQEPKGKLEAEKPGSMCSHKIGIADIKEIDNEVLDWLMAAYNNAGK